VAGIWQILAGFIVISTFIFHSFTHAQPGKILFLLLKVLVIEAPFCCFFLDFVQQISGMVDGRPVWQKALLYLM